MMAGSTRVASCTCRPVARASPSWSAFDALRRQLDRGRDFRPHDLRVVHQPRFVRLRELGEQRQAVAVGEQQEELRDDRRHGVPARSSSSCTTPRFCAAGIAGFVSVRAQLSLPATSCVKPASCAAHELDVGFLVTRRRRARGRSGSRRRGSSSRLLAAARRSDRRGASWSSGVIVRRMRCSATPTASRAACSVSSRRAIRSRMSISRRVCSSSRAARSAAACAIRACSASTSSAPLALQRVELRRQRLHLPRRSRRAARSRPRASRRRSTRS